MVFVGYKKEFKMMISYEVGKYNNLFEAGDIIYDDLGNVCVVVAVHKDSRQYTLRDCNDFSYLDDAVKIDLTFKWYTCWDDISSKAKTRALNSRRS